MMNTQQELFPNSVGPSHHNAPETSHRAALANAPCSGSQRAKVLLAIHNFSYVDRNAVGPGLNDDEIVNASKLTGNSVRPRRGELHRGGFIEDSGGRRSSMLGNDSVVWSLTDKGLRAARELTDG